MEEERNLLSNYRPTSFCWLCGRKLWHKNKPTVLVVDGHPRTLHKFCSKRVEWMSQRMHEKDKEADQWKPISET